MLLLVVAALSLVSLGHCGNYTVTEEAWFDVEVKDMDGPGDTYRGRFVIALFGEAAPVTSLNFLSLAKGWETKSGMLSYKDSPFHRIVPDFVVQGGDITTGDGSGGRSIYGERFTDEQFVLSHRSAGWVAMANHGPDSNGSQFYILLTKARWLDTRHIVFGKVIRGMKVVETLGDVETDVTTAVPKKSVRIVDCGINSLKKKYDLKPEQLDDSSDL